MIMKEKIAGCYDRLQTLDITPTLDNMEKLVQTLYDLREVYKELSEKEEKDNGRGTEADPE